MLLSLALGFLLGVIAVLAAEGLALYWFLLKLSGKAKEKADPNAAAAATGFVSGHNGIFPTEKQGTLWILDEDALVKPNGTDLPVKGTKEHKNKKGIIEVLPAKRTAKIKGDTLVLIDENVVDTTIMLLDCTVLAVSATDLPSRKWYKKYPIKVESNNGPIYNGKRTCFLYAETSSEKESWCKALRLASCSDADAISQNSSLREEFFGYLASLVVQHPLFLKSTPLHGEVTGNGNKADDTSKVRRLIRKITKKVSKVGDDHKSGIESFSYRGDVKYSEMFCDNQDVPSLSGSSRSSSVKSFVQDASLPTAPYGIMPEDLQSNISDATPNEKLLFDEGTFCLNLFFSRLYFDLKRNTDINHWIEARLQRALSNIRTPSYIGGITCTSFDLGNIPLHIQNIRASPVDTSNMLAVDLDIYYSGGFLLDIETRIDVHGPDIQKGVADTFLEPIPENVASDGSDDLEIYNHNSMPSTSSSNAIKVRDEDEKSDDMKQSKSGSWASAYKSRVKMILNSVADHVSQVPLSLSIKVASLQGTLRLHIKPPPSDQLWFGFTSMPEIELNLDSSVGDRRFFNTHVGMIIANRIKGAFREALVLPNSESIYIPWMLAEKNDWVPRNVAPLMWVHPENSGLSSKESPATYQTREFKGNMKEKRCCSADSIKDSFIKANDDLTVGPPVLEPVTSVIDRTTSLPPHHLGRSQALEELKMPLLKSESFPDDTDRRKLESLGSSTLTPILAGQTSSGDMEVKRMGKRDKMFSLGRRVTEKFEEKRRHMEEKGRHIVEKMRENTR